MTTTSFKNNEKQELQAQAIDFPPLTLLRSVSLDQIFWRTRNHVICLTSGSIYNMGDIKRICDDTLVYTKVPVGSFVAITQI